MFKHTSLNAALIAVAAIALTAASANAAILSDAIDGDGFALAGDTGGDTTVLSGFNTGTNGTYLVVAITTSTDGEFTTINSVTFGSTQLTELNAITGNDSVKKGQAALYGGTVSGTQDITVNTSEISNAGDGAGITIIGASFYDDGGWIIVPGAASDGAVDDGNPTSLSDSITTTVDNSVVVSSVYAGVDTRTTTGAGGLTVNRRETSGDGVSSDGVFLSGTYATAGAQSPGVSWSNKVYRAAMVSQELTTIIPEPASIALLGLGGLMIVGRRRRA